MAYSSRPARYRPSRTTGAGSNTKMWQRTAPRLARRSTGPSVLDWGIPGLFALGVGLVLAVCCLGIGAGPAATSSPANAGNTSSNSNPSQEAPHFTLPTLGGGTFQLTGAPGHPVVLYFLETTCATCAQDSQQLAQVMQTANVAGATALAIDVNAGDRPADLQAFVRSVGQPAATTLQWGIDTTDVIATAYGVQTLETTVVINARGQIIARSEGPIPPAQLAHLVQSAG